MPMKMLPLIERISGGILTSSRRTVERDRAPTPCRAAQSKRRPAQHSQSLGTGRHPVHSSHRGSLEHAARRIGLRQRCQLLASTSRLDENGSVVGGPSASASGVGQRRPNRSFARRHRQPIGSRGFWGDHTGPNPTDRGKNGCKRHLIVDASGLPLAIEVTPANVHDSVPAMRLLDKIPPCAGTHGRPSSRPKIFQGDHAYGTPTNLKGTAARGIQPQMQRLGHPAKHGSGLGVFRYVVERTLVWLGHHRRLKVCYEKTGAHFQAFHDLAAAVTCARRLATVRRF